MPFHQAVGNTLARTAFLYTHCMDLYSSLKSDAIHGPQAVYTDWEVPQCRVHQASVRFRKCTCQITKPREALWWKRISVYLHAVRLFTADIGSRVQVTVYSVTMQLYIVNSETMQIQLVYNVCMQLWLVYTVSLCNYIVQYCAAITSVQCHYIYSYRIQCDSVTMQLQCKLLM